MLHESFLKQKETILLVSGEETGFTASPSVVLLLVESRPSYFDGCFQVTLEFGMNCCSVTYTIPDMADSFLKPRLHGVEFVPSPLVTCVKRAEGMGGKSARISVLGLTGSSLSLTLAYRAQAYGLQRDYSPEALI